MTDSGPTPEPAPAPAAPAPPVSAPPGLAPPASTPPASAPPGLAPPASTPPVPAPVMAGAAPLPPGVLATWTPGAPGMRPGPMIPPPSPPTAFTVARDEFWAARRPVATTAALVTCGVVGVLGGALVVGHRPGLGVALVGLAVWAAAVPVLVRRRAFGDLATVALCIALVAMVAVRDAAWVVTLCLLTAALAGAAAATSARTVPAVLLSPLTWCAGAVRSIPWVTHGAGALVGERRGEVLVALRSLAVTVVLLVVFGALFASADTVFASYVPRPDAGQVPGQVVVGLLVALVTAAAAHLALAPPSWSGAALPPARPAGRGEWLLPVGALGALVAAFVLIQVSALLGGHDHVLRTAGLTYPEYARQGFAQLVAVTVLTLLVVGVAARRAPRGSVRDRLVSRVALGVLCVGSIGVVASALRRMDLYVETFGLTRLRLLAGVGEVVLGVLLVLVLVAGIRWKGTWLPRTAVQVVAVAMLALALANPDAQIVQHNTTADAREQLDVVYLRGLSADAVPALDALDEPLRSCVLDGPAVHRPTGLADANLARSRAAAVLDAGAPVHSENGSACTGFYAGSR